MLRGSAASKAAAAAAVADAYIPGKIYFPVVPNFAGASSVGGVTRAAPFKVRRKVTINALGTRVISASGKVIFGIGANNPLTERPVGVCLAQTSEIDIGTAATGVFSSITPTTLLPDTLYWCISSMTLNSGSISGSGAVGTMMGGDAYIEIPINTSNGLCGLTTTVAYTTTIPDLSTLTWSKLSNTALPMFGFTVQS